MSAAGGRLPYPGLRSFTREETDLFFGREGCVDDMVDRLAATRFLAVLGASGSGKSSLVKTGLLDALEIGLLHQAGSRWLIADFRPGDRPVHNLAEGLLRAAQPNPAEPPDEEEVRLLRAFLARGPRSVVEWCEADNLPDGVNLLLLVDQFEELFRYGAYAEREEAEAFVALLLESARAPIAEARIYVAITMRSEYLGAAALIDGLAEAINKGLYLTPRMGRDQVREAIVGPAAVCGFSIESALVNRLLNDLTSFAPWEDADTGHQLERLVRRADQLPLMQHVLNRLWSIAEARSRGGPIVLKLADYDAVGGLRGALAAHGREILDELLPEHQEVASAVFRALTAGSSLAEAVRRPTEFGELVEIAGGDEIAVREIVEAFRAPGRNFLVPPRPTPLRATTLIDISHESLIRQWDEFAGWLQREITSADTWRRLVDATDRYKRGEANLLSGLTLASIANWSDTERPTAAWAKRYGGNFDQAAEFLADSRRAEEDSKQAEIAERRQKSRNRLVTAAVILILCIITPLTGFAGYSAWWANQEALRANQEADAADEARKLAESERLVAETERQRADQERTRALAAQRDAVEQAAAAESERQRADEERQRALAAQQEAMQQAAAAEAERQRADEERRRAIAAQQEAMQQAAAAEAERQRANEERERAVVAQLEAVQAAALAQAETDRADQERDRAERARSEFQRANLQQLAGRIAALQQEGSWEAAANLLGALWERLIRPDDELRENWLTDPIVEAFARQSMAEFPIVPDFLAYSGFTGWSGTSGRFRVYALDRKADAAGADASGNKVIAIFDTVTGSVLGSFELSAGSDLGSELDLVSPDGGRVAIVTDKSEIALWAVGQPAPTLIPVPDLGGDVGVAQLAPVHSDTRFALYLTLDENPNEIIVVDPATQAIAFSVTTTDIASGAALDSIENVKLLGFVDNRIILLVNDSDGRVVTVDATDGTIRVLETGSGVTGAEITPDGAMLLTLTCPGDCAEQHLTALDTRLNAPLWVERVPVGMSLSEAAVNEITIDGVPTYSALVEQEGSGIVFQIPKDRLDSVERLDGESNARIGLISFDGKGLFRTIEAASDTASEDAVAAAGVLANYKIPLNRQKLRLYVAPNSVAVFQGEDTVRIAGVTYDGELLVYRLRKDGRFEEDVAFRPVTIVESDCLATVAFGGDGRSLLFRHIDGSLLYVAAVGKGAGIGWHQRGAGGQEGSATLTESSPATDCEQPDSGSKSEVVEKIVAVDMTGDKFALLDKEGAVWWIDLARGAGAEAEPPSTREFAPLKRASSSMIWIAGDPARGRAALVSRSAVEIVLQGGTVTEEVKAARADATADDQAAEAHAEAEARLEAAAAAGQDSNRRQRLVRWGEPTAATFGPAGEITVAYSGGQISGFRQGEDGAWLLRFDGTFFVHSIVGLFASNERIAVADDRDMIVALDPATGSLSGYSRIPANPSVLALLADGNVLSLEWDTDSVASVAFGDLAPSARIADAARLVTMRSTLDQEGDASLDSLILDHEMELSLTAADRPASVDCAAETRDHLLRLENQLLGDVVAAATPVLAPECSGGDDSGSLAAAETLARRGQRASVRELVEDGAFSRVLQAAAAGDAAANRMLGAVLARIALERGELDKAAIAEDTARFGANLPSTIMPAIAAGGPIDESILDSARRQTGPDAAAHQLLGHWNERRISDVEALGNALLEFSLAERLYHASGRAAEAQFVAHRRAQLARILPDDRVLAIAAAVDAWTPETPDIAPHSGLADLPSDPVVRRALDMENADSLAERLPNSPLLETLRTELERARIIDLRRSDPKAAAELLIDLGRRAGGEAGWSPDLVREYLGLAEEIGDGNGAASAFRLAAEAVKMIGSAFKSPIHANGEASGLFRRAADQVAATAPSAPRDLVAAATDELDLSPVAYEYDNLPGVKDEAESTMAQQVLESAARMAEAVASNSDDPQRWNRLRGLSLFWQGVLVNDKDSAQAAPILRSSADILRLVVEADPSNAEVRFRFAEALRWVGLAEPSTEEAVATEREAIRQYEVLWNDRSKLDVTLLGQLGVGYGFALANLAQTIREINLADLSDGRTAEEHVGWLLDVLALAAEKDDVNTTMIGMGAATGDSSFVGGWYRMSSYGWPIGFLGGLVNVETGSGPVTECDLLAADLFDPLRRAPGLVLDQVKVEEAEAACRAETARNPEDRRASYQLARTMSSDTDRESEYLPLARAAAEAGVSPAFALVADALNEKDDDRSGDAYAAASQRTIIESFAILYPYLESRAETERDQLGLAWYANKAANLGVVEAHIALADMAGDPQRRRFHLELAARLLEETGEATAAADAHRGASAVLVRKADQERIEAEVAVWKPETLVELPADLDAS